MILVLGKNGQLAGALQKLLGKRAQFMGRDALDLANAEAIIPFLTTHQPSAIINAAAYTQVDKAEHDPALAFAVNAHAPAAMAQYAASTGIPFLHYSSDYTYAGKGYHAKTEASPILPLNVYGKSKACGDELIAGIGGKAIILRTSWVYAAQGHNFFNTMLKLMRERLELRVVADQIGAPTSAMHLAQASIEMLDSGIKKSGLYHIANAGEASWHGFAEAILQQAKKRDPAIQCQRIMPITSDEYAGITQRPLNSRLDCSLIAKEYGIKLPHWQEGLRSVMEEKYGNS